MSGIGFGAHGWHLGAAPSFSASWTYRFAFATSALVQKLATVEVELARLQAAQMVKRPALIVPDVRSWFLKRVAGLDEVLSRDPERGREELRGILGGRIKTAPDASGRFLGLTIRSGWQRCLPNAGNYGSRAGVFVRVSRRLYRPLKACG